MSQSPLFPDADPSVQRRAWVEGHYRYALMRTWRPDVRGCTFLMLNPSTADANQDDPTLRRCIGFAKGWGYGSVSVVNLYALRSSSPKALRHVPDPIGAKNCEALSAGLAGADVVCAWGDDVGPDPDHVRSVVFATLTAARQVLALGFCVNGQPRHPLFVRKDAKAVPCGAALAEVFRLELPH